MVKNDVFKNSGIDVEQILASKKDFNQFEKAFLMQKSCPMSQMIASDRLQADPLWNLVPEGHKEFLAGSEEAQTCRLGSAKLSGVDLILDDEDNRENELSEVTGDWEREEKLTFASFEEMGDYLDNKQQFVAMEEMSLYELESRSGKFDSSEYQVSKDMRIIPPSDLLDKKLEEAKDNAKLSMQFHACGEYMRRKYPELKTNENRCNLCKKVAQLGMEMFPATGSREHKEVLNASIMHSDPDEELQSLEYTVKSCMFIKRSALLEEILVQFSSEFDVGRLLNDLQFNIDWDAIQKRTAPLEKDVNSVGAVDTAKNAAGTSDFTRLQDGILSNAMSVPTTKVLVDKCLEHARLAYVKQDKVLSAKAEQSIEAFIKDIAMMYLKRYNMMTNVRWRAKTGKKDFYGNPKYHDTPVLCTRCSHQYACQGAVVAPHITKDYPMKQRT